MCVYEGREVLVGRWFKHMATCAGGVCVSIGVMQEVGVDRSQGVCV